AAAAALRTLVERLPLTQVGPLGAVCVGAAGTVGGTGAGWIRAELQPLCAGPVVVVEDVALPLAAAGLDEGVGLICGTGSAGWGCYAGRSARAGGWGYLLGDEGGGYWLVRRALQTVLDRRDRGTDLGALAADLARAAGAADARDVWRRLYEDPRPGPWARLAPAVLSSADPAVEAILSEAGVALAHLAEVVLDRLSAPDDLPVVLAGGVLEHPRAKAAASMALERIWPARPLVFPTEPPVAGAARLARRALG
ncbi:MAG TPA: BadF/BadG/BcrA/BcrD ATPase family protein, partial [Acidimicrobiales bacterium]|nr:BadF/BadG/BcrA/BcrD ATPase family protein [Acidimicrobiales bacterium]